MDDNGPKHHFNLLKTVEGTGWILCDALNTMVRNEVETADIIENTPVTSLANNIVEIFNVVAECEEPDVIDHLAEKITEFAGPDIEAFLNYMDNNIGDNPLYKKVYDIAHKS